MENVHSIKTNELTENISRKKLSDLQVIEKKQPEISSATGGRVETNLTVIPTHNKEEFDQSTI